MVLLWFVFSSREKDILDVLVLACIIPQIVDLSIENPVFLILRSRLRPLYVVVGIFALCLMFLWDFFHKHWVFSFSTLVS